MHLNINITSWTVTIHLTFIHGCQGSQTKGQYLQLPIIITFWCIVWESKLDLTCQTNSRKGPLMFLLIRDLPRGHQFHVMQPAQRAMSYCVTKERLPCQDFSIIHCVPGSLRGEKNRQVMYGIGPQTKGPKMSAVFEGLVMKTAFIGLHLPPVRWKRLKTPYIICRNRC